MGDVEHSDSDVEHSDSDVEDTPQQNNDLEDESIGSEPVNNMECLDSEKERKIDDEKDEQDTNENDCDDNEDSEEEKSKGVERRERGVTKHPTNRWLLQKWVNKKHRHIAYYKTLAEANKASIIFHESLSETGDWVLAKESTRERMLFHEKASKGVDWRERGVYKEGNRWLLQKYFDK